MQYSNGVSKAKLDQFRQSKGFIKFRVEYIEKPFVKNIKDLDTYKYDHRLEESYIYSFNIDGNILQIHLAMDINKLIILPVVKLKNKDLFTADFRADGSRDNKVVCWFVKRICTEFLDSESESILGSFNNSQTLWETTERFKDMIRKKQSLRDFECSFYYTEVDSPILGQDCKL